MSQQFLFNQLKWSIDDLESWRPEHDEAMRCRDLEDRIRYALFLHARISAASEELAKPTVESDLFLVQFALLWLDFGSVLSHHAAIFETKGYPVDGVEKLRSIVNELSTDRDQLLKTEEKLGATLDGHAVPFSQAMHELRSRNCA